MTDLLALVFFAIGVAIFVFASKKKDPNKYDFQTQSLGNGEEKAENGGLNQKVGVSGGDIRAPVTFSSAKQLDSEGLSGKTYYELLGIDFDATSEMIEEAWRKTDYGQYLPIELRRAYQTAYKTLRDPNERRKYDAKPLRWSIRADSEKGRQSTTASVMDRYSGSPQRTYSPSSSKCYCQACRWGRKTIASGNARNRGAVYSWYKENCTGESLQTKPPKPYGRQATKGRGGYTRGRGTYPPLPLQTQWRLRTKRW